MSWDDVVAPWVAKMGGPRGDSERLEDAVLTAGDHLGGIDLPHDYATLISTIERFDGRLGEGELALWAASDLVRMNVDYNVRELAPGLVLFGSDGANEGYAFDIRPGGWWIVRVPFVPMDREHVIPISRTFVGFLEEVEKGTAI